MIIAHRGNINGPSEEENSPEHIRLALKMGYDVEIDVWYHNNKWFLGHDAPTYEVTSSFVSSLLNPYATKIWIHAKNIKAVEKLSETGMHWFWHDKDEMTLTSQCFMWCYSGVYVKDGITVELGKPKMIPESVLGICTDYAKLWKEHCSKETMK